MPDKKFIDEPRPLKIQVSISPRVKAALSEIRKTRDPIPSESQVAYEILVKWLFEKGHLNKEDLPQVKPEKGRRFHPPRKGGAGVAGGEVL